MKPDGFAAALALAAILLALFVLLNGGPAA
jgi:hypothetical protein